MAFAPVVMFGFKRADCLQASFQALSKCPEFFDTSIFVYVDGARNEAELPQVLEVRDVVSGWAANHPRMVIHFREANLGLASSVREGVTATCAEFGSAIVLEDDILVSPAFLTFMNAGLNQFADDNRIMGINAYTYGPLRGFPHDKAGAMRFSHPWGWATWARTWQSFMDFWHKGDFAFIDSQSVRNFDLGGIESFSDMLRAAERGDISSWWIRWYYFVFVSNGYGIFPPDTLVQNIGILNDPTHQSWSARLLEGGPRNLLPSAPSLPEFSQMDPMFSEAYIAAMKPIRRRTIRRLGRLRTALKQHR